MNSMTLAPDYVTIRDGAAIHLRPMAGALLLTDADRVDFLQRMTTNDIAALQPGESAVTVLTNATARTLYVFTVLARADDLLVLPALGQTAALASYLRGQIFFMDKVKVQDVSESYTRMRVMGAQARTALTQAGIALAEAPDGAFIEQDGIVALRQDNFDIPGVELLVPAVHEQPFLGKLTATDAAIVEDIPALKARRVELGRPGVGRELSEDYNPLESGLAWACAEDKGCYTGQEIIARQITYDKVTRTLVGLRGDQPMGEGADVLVDGRKVGSITSAAHSPTLDAPIALAILKRPHNEVGMAVAVNDTHADVVELPFVTFA